MDDKPQAVIPFNFGDNLVRVVDRNALPWWIATDVAAILGFRDASNMVRDLDEDEKGTHNVSTLGGDQSVIIINESGLYSAVLRSRRPEAKRFRKWVTGELLPTIRKTGFFQTAGHRAAQLENTERASARRELPGLLDRLRREGNAEVRRIYHQMIVQHCATLDIAPPAIEAIGRETPAVPDLVEDFWAALAMLDEKRVAYNHSRNSALVAVQLAELKEHFQNHGCKIVIDGNLREALKLCPRFVKAGTVNSAIHLAATHCWVFKTE